MRTLDPNHVNACGPDAYADRFCLQAGDFCARPRKSFRNANSPRMSAGADNSLGIRTYEKCAHKSFRMRTYKIIGGGYPPPVPPQLPSFFPAVVGNHSHG